MNPHRKFLAPLAILIPLAMVLLWGGCTKEGPAGVAGKDGKDGLDNSANLTCTQCHINDQLLAKREQQWERTKHAEGLSFEEQVGARATCQPCHNGINAAIYLSGDSATRAAIKSGVLDTASLYNVTNINCRVCHMVHTNYDTSDFRLRSTAVVPSRRLPNYTYPDMGKGNLCVVCHDYRDRPPMDTAVHNDSVTITSTRFGAHVATQAGMFVGVGGYEDPDYASLKQSGNHSTLIKDACVTCHVGAGNGQSHNFVPQVATCNVTGCHASKPMSLTNKILKDSAGTIAGSAFGNDTLHYFTTDSSSIEVQVLINEVRDSLIAKGLIKLDATDEYYGFSGIVTVPPTTVSRQWAGLLQNFRFVSYDLSKGVHNAKYMKYLLVSGLKGIGVTRDLSKLLN